VGDDDGVEVFRRQAQAGQTLRQLARAETAIDQQTRFGTLNHQCIAAAAAAKGSEAQATTSLAGCAVATDQLHCVFPYHFLASNFSTDRAAQQTLV
jgi:hypothetical protein